MFVKFVMLVFMKVEAFVKRLML